jgi:predicted TIM-barrel fold metal-dependent hydrolase
VIDATGAGWDSHVHVFDAQAPVRAGHYRPAHHPLADIEATATGHGVQHLVLVQPSVYGHDNRLLLQALAQQPGRHRGVVVLAGDESDATLDAMHAAGVRGARLNAVSPVGAPDLAAAFAWLAPRLRARGWHLQWYVAAEQLPQVAALHAGSGLVAVLDHLGGLRAGLAPEHPAWAALQALAEGGAWVKLSGWYRLDAAEPYAALWPHVRRVAALCGPRLVWGSDWPHTSFAPEARPAHASTWAPAVASLGAARAQALHAGAAALYG